MSNLANYTSEVPAVKSFQEIQDMLAAHGAEKVMIDYKDGQPVGITFVIATSCGKLPFSLPAKIENVQAILRKRRKTYNRMWGQQKEVADRHDKTQAPITAWRNLRDWTRAQLALIETDQVSLDQVFLPYLLSGEKTVYDIFREGHLRLGPGKDTQEGEFREVKEA